MSGEGTIEVVAFMDLTAEFRARGWKVPHLVPLAGEITGTELLSRLEIPETAVESLFVNHRAVGTVEALIRPGDRVALVPPGVPGPHRFCLGIYQRK